MKKSTKVITLTFTEYEQYPDREYDPAVFLHTPDDRWITEEEMLDEYLFPAFRQTYERMKPGDTLRILLQILPPEAKH